MIPHPLALETKELAIDLGGQRILSRVNLSIPAGTWTSIIGANGIGKSTLLKGLASLLPVEGAVFLHGQLLDSIPMRERARQLAWLGSGGAEAQDWQVEELVMLGRLPHQAWLSTPSEQDRSAVKQALLQTHLWEKRLHIMQRLSAGEQQRALLSRALATTASVLLMDEPLTHLDPPHQADWLAQMRAFTGSGGTVLSVLHDIAMSLRADSIIILGEGGVYHQGLSSSPSTHLALEEIFNHRWQVRFLEGQWLWLPV